MSIIRPSFEEIYLKLAHELSARSTCSRLKVGTVITTEDFRKVLAIGYNGNAIGFDNKCDSDEQGNCGCLHSEENAIINCDTSRDVLKIVFVTHMPCKMCVKRLINLGGVLQICYDKEYRSTEAVEMCKRAGIWLRRIRCCSSDK